MKIHYLNGKGEEVFLTNIMHIQNVDNGIFIAVLRNGKELTLSIDRIEGIYQEKYEDKYKNYIRQNKNRLLKSQHSIE